jgi:anti-sigma regulatory factor (Ser/Thr protein kinase)
MVTAAFAPRAETPSEARRFVEATLRRWHCNDIAEVACLLTSELVTNAVLHARSRVELVVARTDGGVRVEVHDSSPRPASAFPVAVTDTRGRGLGLVDRLSDDWGVDPLDPGKSVWFALSP